MTRKDLVIMNSETTQTFKKYVLVFFALTLIFSCYAVNFNASLNRFLNEKNETVFEINYKIFNDQLKFIKTEQGYVASLDVSFNLLKDGKVVLNKDFPNYIGAKTDASAASSTFYTIDKISLTLTRDDLVAELVISDRNTKQSSKKTFELKTLDKKAMVSDLEVSQNIKSDKSNTLEKFHRGDLLFYVDPVPIFTNIQDSLYLYYEIYNISESADSTHYFSEEISISKADSVFYQYDNSINVRELPFQTFKTIPIKNLEEGYYQLNLTISDLKTQTKSSSTTHFSMKKPHVNITRIFDDDESEFALISYFLSTKEKKQWKKLNENGRKNFIDRFWKSKDPTPNDNQNEFINEIKKRMDYTNWKYSHFDKGWTTDLGRIYIKNGEPDEKIEKTTGLGAKYSKKDYQIWKYNYGSRIYMFMDMFDSGRYRLIYSKNDLNEKTDPNWRTFFEKDWDDSLVDESDTSSGSSSSSLEDGWKR